MIKQIVIFILGATLFHAGILGIPMSFAQDSSSAEETSGGTIPTIPKPELLPGPAEQGVSQEEVQNYFRNEAIPTFINGFLGLVAGIALLGVIVSGIRFITAYGEEEGITAAKKTAVWSVIGFGISILAYALVSIINTLAFPQGEGTYTPDQQEVEYEDI